MNRTGAVDLQELAKLLSLGTTSLSGLAALRGAALVADLTNQLEERFFNVNTSLGRGLEERASPLLGSLLTFLGGNLSLSVQIAFVANEDHRDLLGVLDSE
jgi:hypothetical protein